MYAPTDFYSSTPNAAKPNTFVLFLHTITVVCLVALTLCASSALQAYHKDVAFRTQPPPEPVAEAKSCTTEQALQWWTNSKDLNTVRAKLCGTRAQSKHKGKS